MPEAAAAAIVAEKAFRPDAHPGARQWVGGRSAGIANACPVTGGITENGGMTWRELVVPQPIVAFIAEVWMDVNVDEFNDESGEVKAFAPGHSTQPLVLDRSRYRPLDASTFPGELCDIDHHRLDTRSRQ